MAHKKLHLLRLFCSFFRIWLKHVWVVVLLWSNLRWSPNTFKVELRVQGRIWIQTKGRRSQVDPRLPIFNSRSDRLYRIYGHHLVGIAWLLWAQLNCHELRSDAILRNLPSWRVDLCRISVKNQTWCSVQDNSSVSTLSPILRTILQKICFICIWNNARSSSITTSCRCWDWSLMNNLWWCTMISWVGSTGCRLAHPLAGRMDYRDSCLRN